MRKSLLEKKSTKLCYNNGYSNTLVNNILPYYRDPSISITTVSPLPYQSILYAHQQFGHLPLRRLIVRLRVVVLVAGAVESAIYRNYGYLFAGSQHISRLNAYYIHILFITGAVESVCHI